MIPWLVAGAIGAVLVASFWDEIVDFLKDVWREIKNFIRDAMTMGVEAAGATFIKRIVRKAAMAFINKFYKKKSNGKWEITTKTAEVEESEVPAYIRQQARDNKEVDVTRDVRTLVNA